MKKFYEEHKWKRSTADHFWDTLAPYDHVIHIYDDDKVFTAMLAAFVRVSLQTGNGVILIASVAHRLAVEQRLQSMDMPVEPHLGRRYFPVDAQILLSSILVQGLPDEGLFNRAISSLLKQARIASRKVFSFSEMVALLWRQGNQEGTYLLEKLWASFSTTEALGILHSYPFNGFGESSEVPIQSICSCHSKMIASTSSPDTHLLYVRL